ncbi:uncharacterized protein LOC135386357 [Ornithodoros turicata]|uniref:uncharacterized protein LOC135386357 n=1 Tax=Ornithodoros turicata TaxID=34597 RepID=UPI0031397B4E
MADPADHDSGKKDSRAQVPRRCTAIGCRNISRGSRHSFFRFPVDERKSAWIEYAQRPELNDLTDTALTSRLLCGEHFAQDCFVSRARVRLKRNACPTVPLPEQASAPPQARLPGLLALDYDKSHQSQKQVQGSPGISEVPVVHGEPVLGSSDVADTQSKAPVLDPDSVGSSVNKSHVIMDRASENSSPGEQKDSRNPPSSRAASTVPRIDLTQLEDVSKDVVIPNILASLPPALASMVANSACKIQAFRAPQSTVQLVIPKSSSVFTTAATTSHPQDSTLLPGCKGTHLFRLICSNPTVPPVDKVSQQTLFQLPVEAAQEHKSPLPRTEHAYVTKVDVKTVLEKIDKAVESVNKKNRKVQASRHCVRKEYLKMKNYLKHLNELRKAKGMPIIMLQEDLKDAKIVRADDAIGDNGREVADNDVGASLDVTESAGVAKTAGITEGVKDNGREVTDNDVNASLDVTESVDVNESVIEDFAVYDDSVMEMDYQVVL